MFDLVSFLRQFLQRHRIDERPPLLALSGGPDSMALFWLLIELRRLHELEGFAVVHIDHHWRKESRHEALLLQQLMERERVPFYFYQLPPPDEEATNLEDRARQARLAIFLELLERREHQAILLGHHADDQAETVLKRLFEGACLESLQGMRPVSRWPGELLFWRPFLKLPKRVLVDWLQARGLSYFSDGTNSEERFLRGRMRNLLLPKLEQHFGKNIVAPLAQLAKRMVALEEHMERYLSPFIESFLPGPFGIALELPPPPRSLDLFSSEYLLRRLCRQASLTLSHQQLEEAALHLFENRPGLVQFSAQVATLYVELGRAVALLNPFLGFPKALLPYQLSHEGGSIGQWRYVYREDSTQSALLTPLADLCGWRGLWQGDVEYIMPQGNYQLLWRHQLPPSWRKRLDEWHRRDKVPCYLRPWLPVAYAEEERFFYDLATNRLWQPKLTAPFLRPAIRLSLTADGHLIAGQGLQRRGR